MDSRLSAFTRSVVRFVFSVCVFVPLLLIVQTSTPVLADSTHPLGSSAHNPELPPPVTPTLEWNTFLGSNAFDLGLRVVADREGNVYVAGESNASWGSPVRAYIGGSDAFVARLDRNGKLVWNTFLGEKATDDATGLALDDRGGLYVAGQSGSSWGSPVRAYSGGQDAYVAKLDARTGALKWNTFLGSAADDDGAAIALDRHGNIYVAGTSHTSWGSPLSPYVGMSDVFVAKLNGGGVLLWNTFMGSSDSDTGEGIAIDSMGNTYVKGISQSTWGSPVRSFSGTLDGFVAKLNPSGAAVWNTFLGPNDFGGQPTTMAIDSHRNVYVSGQSNSSWGSPVRAHSGGFDAYVAKVNADGTLGWNTFLGSTGDDFGWGVALDPAENVFVVGQSTATWGTPASSFSGGTDAFVSKLDKHGALRWNTFLGSSDFDGGRGIAVGRTGSIFAAGGSVASWGSPVRAYSGDSDAFVTKLSTGRGDEH